MSDDHSTRRLETGSYEPTQYAKNPYETTAAYDVPPIPPPPPPNNKRSWWYIAVPILMVVALVVLIAVPSIALSRQPTHTPVNHLDPGGTAAAQAGATQGAADTATASVPTPTPTPHPTIIVETPTPVPQPTVTAVGIFQDFVNAGINAGPWTAMSSSDWSSYQWYPTFGSGYWYDPYIAGGNTAQQMAIAVFKNVQPAIDDENQLQSLNMVGDRVGSCLLFWGAGNNAAANEPPDLQAYINVMLRYCPNV